MTQHIPEEARTQIVAAARKAALALEEFWDVLRPFEKDDEGHGFEGTLEMLAELAAFGGTAPDFDVWKAIEACWGNL
jgi:hypothetical protein